MSNCSTPLARWLPSAGFHGVSIEAVSREAGVTRPIVYGHFGDLPGLLEALVDREEARARAQLVEVLPGPLAEGDPDETLLAALDAYLRAVQAEPDTWRLVLMPQEGAPQVLHDRIARGRAAVIAQLVESITPGWARAASHRTPSSPRSRSPRYPTRPRGCCSPSRAGSRWSGSWTTRAGCFSGWRADAQTASTAAPSATVPGTTTSA